MVELRLIAAAAAAAAAAKEQQRKRQWNESIPRPDRFSCSEFRNARVTPSLKQAIKSHILQHYTTLYYYYIVIYYSSVCPYSSLWE